MTPEAWQEVKKYFQDAVEQTPGERKTFLDNVCVDAAIRREVESLLAAHEQSRAGLLSNPAGATRDLPDGSRLAGYEILGRIGAGGMGDVYRATDTRLRRSVAIKVLPAEFVSDPVRLARFEQEARLLASLNHPNIVILHSLEESSGVHFLVMELVDGQPLNRLIPKDGLPIDQILNFAAAISEALAAAHDKAIVHRDLKPSNVMVTADGHVKVLDFGLAKEMRAAALEQPLPPSAGFTETGTVLGTPPYRSPEQIAGRAVDHRSDIFSLGTMLYEMASGQRPFQADSPAELASAILRDAPRSLSALRPGLPDPLCDVILRCLEKNPADRFACARDLRDALAGNAATKTETRISNAVGSEEGFWIAVLPFESRGEGADLAALAEGMTEGIVTGLSRFPYLRVIARSSVLRYAHGPADVRAVGQGVGARYVLEGSLRQSGPTLRTAVQLVETASGAHLWAETYDRAFHPEDTFALQDELVPPIVSTVADAYGVLPHVMSEALRGRDPVDLTPYQAVLRSFAHFPRLSSEEHATVRSALEHAVQQAPNYADAWAMLSMLYRDEYAHLFNVRADPLGRALSAATRAVEAAPSNHLAFHALAAAQFFRREFQAFRNSAARALALNPMDGFTTGYLSLLIAYSGEWARGCALAERARNLNPHHPGWYWSPSSFDAYRKRDYRAALHFALKVNMPGYWQTHLSLAAAYGQLGELEAARSAVRDLLSVRPDFSANAREVLTHRWDPELVEHLIEGLRKAGLEVSS